MIDFENVGADGLAGCDKLTALDHIYIFFTQNAKKIDMGEIAQHGQSEIKMIEVPAGKQSTDIHIGSYLGYLAGKYVSENKAKSCRVVIISKDTDYDNLIKFWTNGTEIKASRSLQIKKAMPKSTSSKQAVDSPNKTTQTAGQKKCAANVKVQQILSKANFANDITNYVASVVTKNIGVKNGKQQIYRTIISKYGQNKGLNIYNHIKKHI